METFSAQFDCSIAFPRIAIQVAILRRLKTRHSRTANGCLRIAGGDGDDVRVVPTEIDGLDYVLCNKIFRKFESLNLSYIRDEIDGLILYLSELFGEENMQESKEYINRLKKLF